MSAPFGRRIIAIVVLVLSAAGVGLWVYLHRKPAQQNDLAGVPAVSTSPYLNTGPDATYVGSAACIRCHEAEHKSYLRTGMARSTSEVDAMSESADAIVEHPASGRRYKVERKDGQLWHRELMLKSDTVLNEFPLKYAVGSGRFGKTYLVEADGFLVESPLSYYTAKQSWAMSPGYDGPHQVGFERSVGSYCVSCHL